MSEPLHGPTGPGSVVLSLGPGAGALILTATAADNGREIEISPAGDRAAPRTHSQVRERRGGTVTSYAAVYPDLAPGRYTIWRHDGAAAGTVTVPEATVASFRWPGQDR
jgi:hypothetical protein